MENLPISALDLFVIVVLVISAVLSSMRGFVHELLSFAAWVVAALGALFLQPFAQPIARKYIPIAWAADAAALAALFLILMVALSLVTAAVSKTVKASALSGLDRSLGAVFGLARGAAILAVLLMLADGLMGRDARPAWINTAKTLPLIQVASDELREFMPDSFMAAEQATTGLAGTARQALELKETLEQLTQPAPGAQNNGASVSAAPASGDQTRGDLQGLLQGTSAEGKALEESGKAQLQGIIESGKLSPQQKQMAERLLKDPALQARARAEAQRLMGSGQMDPTKMEKAKALLAKQGISLEQLKSMAGGGNIGPGDLPAMLKLLESGAELR